jgi:hypothetical protein
MDFTKYIKQLGEEGCLTNISVFYNAFTEAERYLLILETAGGIGVDPKKLLAH